MVEVYWFEGVSITIVEQQLHEQNGVQKSKSLSVSLSEWVTLNSIWLVLNVFTSSQGNAVSNIFKEANIIATNFINFAKLQIITMQRGCISHKELNK